MVLEKSSIELEFSQKYDREHSRNYFHKHRASFSRRLSHWRDLQLARAALRDAGNPDVVLDLPCGAGRFWPLLTDHGRRAIFAADNSADMLATAQHYQPEAIVRQVRAFQTSAFRIDMADCSVDGIFCMRLLHHVQASEHRQAILKEFFRVSRDSVVLSLWVDGNYKARRRAALERKRSEQGRLGKNRNRFVVAAAVIEREFAEAGFEVISARDFLPGYSMWRVYTLRKLSGGAHVDAGAA